MGAKMVARAWVDPEYKQRMLTDGNAAAEEVGLDRGPYKLVVVENTPAGPQRHRVHACAPAIRAGCSDCRRIGTRAATIASRVVREPRAVLREFGLDLPDSVDRARARFQRRHALPGVADAPGGHRGLDEDQLATLVTRDSMIGVTEPVAAT